MRIAPTEYLLLGKAITLSKYDTASAYFWVLYSIKPK